MTLGIVNVSSRGQIVIPEKIRKSMGIKEGSKLVAMERNDELVLTKESDVMKKLQGTDKHEEAGWLALAERSLKDIWDNKKDDENETKLHFKKF